MSDVVANTPVARVVVGALARRAGIDESDVDLGAALTAIPEIDSLALIKSLADVEDACGVEVPDDVLFMATSVGHLIELIEELR